MNRLSRWLHLTNRTVRDVHAVRQGKVAGRVGNRIIGRASSRLLSRVWFR